jgi:hypothetical protein
VTIRLAVFFSALFALAACPSAAQPPAPAAAAKAPTGPRFDIAIDAPTRGTKGTSGSARIVVSPRAPWHVNLDYAPKLTVTPTTGVAFDRSEQRGDQAERFDADGLAFVLPFRMQDKGAKRIAGELHFAMCANDACAPESVPVDFTIDVGCDTDTVC